MFSRMLSCTLLLQCLRDHGLYESEAEATLREEVLGTLGDMMSTWIRKVAQRHGGYISFWPNSRGSQCSCACVGECHAPSVQNPKASQCALVNLSCCPAKGTAGLKLQSDPW